MFNLHQYFFRNIKHLTVQFLSNKYKLYPTLSLFNIKSTVLGESKVECPLSPLLQIESHETILTKYPAKSVEKKNAYTWVTGRRGLPVLLILPAVLPPPSPFLFLFFRFLFLLLSRKTTGGGAAGGPSVFRRSDRKAGIVRRCAGVGGIARRSARIDGIARWSA